MINIQHAVFSLIGKLRIEKTQELAYLMPTGKIENYVRDNLAIILHQELQNEYFICREWKGKERTQSDIAIVDKSTDEPICIIELKAHSMVKYEKGYSDEIKNDLQKMKIKANDDTELYYIFSNNLVLNKNGIDPQLKQTMTYYKGITLEAKKGNQEQIAIQSWERYLDENLFQHKEYLKIKIHCGPFYDNETELLLFFYGPFNKSDIKV